MTREERADIIGDLCSEHNCSEKAGRIHFTQYVDRQWHPHPPEDFVVWFKTLQDWIIFKTNPRVAWNCQLYRDEWMEAKQYGAA